MEENDNTRKKLYVDVSLGSSFIRTLMRINAIADIYDIIRPNVDIESSTTMVEFQEWRPIKVLTKREKQWGDPSKCKNDVVSKI